MFKITTIPITTTRQCLRYSSNLFQWMFPGYFPVPKLVCVAWYSLDVLFTSSTICHLCMISIDRYMTLMHPLRFGHSRRKRHTALKITVVWIISFCIAGPLFVLSMFDTQQSTVHYKGCGPETPLFIITATVTSFYLPLLIMTVMYALTVRALKRHLLEQRRLAVGESAPHQRHLSTTVEDIPMEESRGRSSVT